MKTLNQALVVAMICMIASCNIENVRTWSDEKVRSWFELSDWNSLPMKPVPSTDIRELVEQNVLSSENWKAAYDFLKNTDFSEIPQGRYDLNDNGLYATVTDYETKDTALFEAHRKYVDIQYVSRGNEMIRVGLTEKKIPRVDFDKSNDIEFFDLPESETILVDSSVFAVFFPKDAHMPCLKTGKKSFVRKIVIKIPYVN